MADFVMIPCPDGWLRLSTDAYRQALNDACDAGFRAISSPGAAYSGAQGVPTRLVDAREMGEMLGFSAWTTNDMARRGVIPSAHVGRARRFDPVAVVDALKRPPDKQANAGLQPVESTVKKKQAARKSSRVSRGLSGVDTLQKEGS